MRCQDVDAIIDEHRGAALDASARVELDAHLALCRHCSAAWLTNEALVHEPIAAPAAGAFAAMARRVREHDADRDRDRVGTLPAPVSPWRWQAVAGLAALLLVAVLFAVVERRPGEVPEPALVEGRDYRVLPLDGRPSAFDARPATRAARGRVEVVELFAYDCTRCSAFEPRLADWVERRGDAVTLVRVPVQWNPRATEQARAFYAAATLGRADEMQQALYERIQTAGQELDTPDALAAFFADYGVDRPTLERALESPEVERSLREGRALADAYAVDSVPTIVVGGGLVTSADLTRSAERLVEVVDRLVECVEHAPPRRC